jgi:hypothetical protein
VPVVKTLGQMHTQEIAKDMSGAIQGPGASAPVPVVKTPGQMHTQANMSQVAMLKTRVVPAKAGKREIFGNEVMETELRKVDSSPFSVKLGAKSGPSRQYEFQVVEAFLGAVMATMAILGILDLAALVATEVKKASSSSQVAMLKTRVLPAKAGKREIFGNEVMEAEHVWHFVMECFC